MTATVPKTIDLPPEGAEMVPVFIDPELVVTPDGNPAYASAELTDLANYLRRLLDSGIESTWGGDDSLLWRDIICYWRRLRTEESK